MFKMTNILQSRIKEISEVIHNVLVFTKDQQRITDGNAIFTQDEQITGQDQSIIATGEERITASEASSEASERLSVSSEALSEASERLFVPGEAPSVPGEASTVSSKRPSAPSEASTVSSKRPSVSSRGLSVPSKSHSVKSKAPSVKRKRSSVQNVRRCGKNMLSPEVKDFIRNADEYLHYANGMLFFLCNVALIENFMVLRSISINDKRISGSSILFILLYLNKLSKTKPVYFILRAENANVFEGVIERYCGVPP